MKENKPRIEDDFKNLFNVLRQSFKKIFPMLDFSFLKDYDKDLHIGILLIYNILYIVTFVCWLFLFILGFEFENGFSIIKFTKDYFFTGEFVTLDAWRIHLVINLILFFKCLDYGKTEMKRKLHSKKFHNKEEILQFYKGIGWKFPKEDGKD
jgi:hypothetical protein